MVVSVSRATMSILKSVIRLPHVRRTEHLKGVIPVHNVQIADRLKLVKHVHQGQKAERLKSALPVMHAHRVLLKDPLVAVAVRKADLNAASMIGVRHNQNGM